MIKTVGYSNAPPVIVVFVLLHFGHDATVSSTRLLALASRLDDPKGCVSALANQIREDLAPWETHGITVAPDNSNLCEFRNEGHPCQ